MPELTTVQHIVIWILPTLFAITLHEASHAWVACRLGDNSAKALGRLSFNPLRHIDILGTVIVPITILLLSQFHFVFGWAKPVPIDSRQLKNPRWDMALIAAAGPISNLLMAIIWTGLLKLSLPTTASISLPLLFLVLTAQAGVMINLLLAFLNLIPLPPLDGGRIAMALLPYKGTLILQKIEPYGFFLLLALLWTGILSTVLTPLIEGTLVFLRTLFFL